ncbi:hypothetical protein BKA70DRAFT_1239324 [Coprinopsis sp. MPI-PUGE-AT-0042]|nr:hypothetical protein BKA70DRAFT_1239324 [Coprinopsis sp. MPI-PUGE-AT-0042]
MANIIWYRVPFKYLPPKVLHLDLLSAILMSANTSLRLPQPNDRLVVVSSGGTLGYCNKMLDTNPPVPCGRAIYLKVCRGIDKPEHAGMYYEAQKLTRLKCGESTSFTAVTHFICWRPDLELAYINEEERAAFDARFMNNVETIINMPLTPRKDGLRYTGDQPLNLPPLSPFRFPSPRPPSTPSSLRTSNARSRNPSPLKQAFPGYGQSLSSPTRSPARDATPGAAEEHSGDDGLSNISGTTTAGESVAPDICSGDSNTAVCLKRAKFAKKCSFRSCKSCCINQQLTSGMDCKLTDHRRGAQAQKPDTVPEASMAASSSSQPTVMYGGPKPLALAHYEARSRAYAEANHLIIQASTDRKRLAQMDARRVELKYWNREDDEPLLLSVEFVNFPMCQLSSLCNDEKGLLGITGDTSLISLYDAPRAVWISQKASMGYKLEHKGTSVPTLLLRSIGATRTDGMKEAERQVAISVGRAPNRTQPILIDFDGDMDDTARTPQMSLKRPLSPSAMSYDESRPKQKPRPAEPAVALNLSTSSHASRPLVKPNRKCSEPVSRSTRNESEQLSAHAPWPLRYFSPMERGLTRVSDARKSDLTGTAVQRFEQHFHTPYKRTAYYTHLNTLSYAPPRLRQHFREMDGATWSHFRSTVLKVYEGDRDVSSRLKGGRESGKGVHNQTHRRAEPTPEAIEAADKWLWDVPSPLKTRRVEDHKDALDEVWEEPSASSFYDDYLNSLVASKSTADVGISDKSSIWNYGPQVLELILQCLRQIFAEAMYTHHDDLQLDYKRFLQVIMLPETMTLLLQEDSPNSTTDELLQAVRNAVNISQAVETPVGQREIKREDDGVATDFLSSFSLVIEDGKEIIVLSDDDEQ